MSNDVFEAVLLFFISLVLLSVLVILSILFVSLNNCREHENEQYILCIESGNEWISGSCVYRSTFRGMKDAD